MTRRGAALAAMATALWWPAFAWGEAPRVVLVVSGPGPVVGEMAEQLRAHLWTAVPGAMFAQHNAAGDPSRHGAALAAALAQKPDVLVTVGPQLTDLALGTDLAGARLYPVAIPEHMAPLLASKHGKGELVAALDGCSFETLSSLTTQLAPGAKRVGWLYSPGPPPSALSATLRATVEGRGGVLEALEVGPSTREATVAFAKRQDVLWLAYPPLDNEVRRDMIRAALEARRPLFSCDMYTASAGGTAAFNADGVQIGVEAGRVVGETLAGKRGALETVKVGAGVLTVNLRAACEVGIEVPERLLKGAIVHEREHVCQKRAATPRWPMGLGAAVLAIALVAAARRALTRAHQNAD